MTTAKEVITDALEDINEQAAESPIEATDGQAGLRYLNDMMFMWDAKGIALGYTVMDNLGETLTVAPGAIAGIKAHLSIFLSSKFRAEVSPGLAQRAKEGWAAILNLIVGSTERSYPDILPVGSGNSYPGVTSRQFYSQADPAISSENGGLIALEIDTED